MTKTTMVELAAQSTPVRIMAWEQAAREIGVTATPAPELPVTITVDGVRYVVTDASEYLAEIERDHVPYADR